ncbi:hypothetical protein [uncultured Intestinimonas sp.]|uniref:hypothetical protein n=1 Tax=uncultured Intestinimonas sp. TaxID=1689265 RepID=UPI002943AC32|nr:hypothetical protein [uncultured Intestinimonas sp.]
MDKLLSQKGAGLALLGGSDGGASGRIKIAQACLDSRSSLYSPAVFVWINVVELHKIKNRLTCTAATSCANQKILTSF